MLCFVFIRITIKIDHLYLRIISPLHALNAFVPYEYVMILSDICNFLSSLLLNAILLICSVHTLSQPLLNLCCDFSMVLSLNKQSA